MARSFRWAWAAASFVACLGLAASCTSILGDDFVVTNATGAGGVAGSSVGGGGHSLGGGGQGLGGGTAGNGGHAGAAGGGGAPPTLSQQRVLFWSDESGIRQIHSMRLDGTDRQQLTDTGDDVLFGSVSADGSTIAYTRGNDIWVMNGDGSNVRQLTTNAASDYRPALNVDGTLLAFVSERDGPRNIYFATTSQGDAGPVQRVTNATDEATFPQFSPDSQWITYSNYASGDVYRVRTDGTETTNLTNYPGPDYCSAYSPDGSTIVFTSERDGWPELYRMAPDGSNPTRITNQTSADNLIEVHASFDMTGQWLVYYAGVGNQTFLFRTSIDGSTTVRLTPDPVAYSDGKLATWTFPD